jgi:hypothetical protein
VRGGSGHRCIGGVTPMFRLIASILVLMLGGACASQPRLRLDVGPGRFVEDGVPSPVEPIKLDRGDFEAALLAGILEFPLRLPVGNRIEWVRTSAHGDAQEVRWRNLMRKSFGGLCRANQRNTDCLSFHDDVSAMSEAERLGVSLGLSLEPLKSSIASTVADTLAPQVFYTIIATGLVTWTVLAANPEPVFTKAGAVISALLIIYLGVDSFLNVVDASRELKRATDNATTPGQLDQAARRFALRVGPEIARLFVLVVSAAVSHGMTGGAATLATWFSKLPGPPGAVLVGTAPQGLNLANVGHVSAVMVTGSTVVVSLPATAFAMAASKSSGAGGRTGALRSWRSFNGFKGALGPAEQGNQWHHIVEQTPGNVSRFGPEALHNTENVIQLDQRLHQRLSGFYSSIQQEITGSRSLTVRQWLSTQSLAAQRDFGLKAIEKVQNRIWGVWK